MPNIEYLSPPAEVSMADQWFEIADHDHFWIKRRFQILGRLAGDLIRQARDIAEIGCGHGLLQQQIEQKFGKEVHGFDLNDFALRKNVSERSKVSCYDIYQQQPALREKFNLILLFDVLEHIRDEDRFIQAVLFHLAPTGKLIINVPAGEWAHSAYDVAAGHERRYTDKTLSNALVRNGLKVTEWSYWGLPLAPALVARKMWFRGAANQNEIIRSGFAARNSLVNRLMGLLARCEVIPQKLLGTSLMTICQRRERS